MSMAYRCKLAALSALATAMILSATPVLAKTEQVPATRIALDVPAGYTAAKKFSGFINETTGASIVVAEMPAAAFAEIKTDFAAKLASNGFANVTPGKLSMPGEHIYLTAEQATAAGAVSKFLLIFADAKATAMLTVNILKADVVSGKTKAADIEKMLGSAHFEAATATALPPDFILAYLGPFKAAGSFLQSQLYTLDGKMDPGGSKPGRPVFIVAASLATDDMSDLALTSKTALTSLFDLDKGAITQQGAVSINGLEGYEIEIAAPRKKHDFRAAAYQVILKTKDGGYTRMVGTTNAEAPDSSKLVAEFRKMAASFKAAAPP